MTPAKKDFLSLLDHSRDEIEQILTMAGTLKANRSIGCPAVLSGKTGVLLFEKPSLRTLVTFHTAITELGGAVINLPNDSVQLGKRETPADVARNLDRWVHLLVARTYRQQTITELAANCSMPVINALSDTDHPCQALAFGLTLREHNVSPSKGSVVFVGDGNNVCSAIMILCAHLGYRFTLACPNGYNPPASSIETYASLAARNGGSLRIVHDPVEAVADASAIYTDVWASMGQETQRDKRKHDFAAFSVNDKLLGHAPSDVLVSHCLPAHRGEEITSEVLDSPRCVALDEAENRLHVQKAVILHLFS